MIESWQDWVGLAVMVILCCWMNTKINTLVRESKKTRKHVKQLNVKLEADNDDKAS